MATAAIAGTVGDGATEAEIVAGTGTITITLTGDTWIAGGGTIRYFGACDVNGTKDVNYVDDVDNSGGGVVSVCNGTEVWTCPGTGNQSVLELSAYVKMSAGSCNIRMGIYSSDGSTLVASADSEIAVSNTSYEWKAMTSITGGPLTGGTNYKLFLTTDIAANTLYFAAKTGSSGISKYVITDYTTNLPSDLTGITENNTLVQAVRVKVSGA
jgi:hypothetical protein